MNVLAARLRQTTETVAAVSFLTVKARLARALLQLAELAGEDDGAGRVVIHHKIGQSDLAAMAGAARENVSRVMCDWKRRKVVTRSSGFYCLTDITTLKRNSFNGTWLRKPNGDERLGRSSPMSNARDNAETAPRFERSTLPGPANRLWQLQRAHSASRRPMSDDETKPPAPEEQALDKEALDGFRDYAPTAVEEAKYIVALAPEKPAQARSTPAAASRADGAEDTRQCRPLPLAFVLRSPHRRTASRLS